MCIHFNRKCLLLKHNFDFMLILFRPKSKEDVQRLLAAIRMILPIFHSTIFKKNGFMQNVIPLEPYDKLELNSHKYWICVLRQYTYSSTHLGGTSKVGCKNDTKAVDDSRYMFMESKSWEKTNVPFYDSCTSWRYDERILKVNPPSTYFIMEVMIFVLIVYINSTIIEWAIKKLFGTYIFLKYLVRHKINLLLHRRRFFTKKKNS